MHWQRKLAHNKHLKETVKDTVILRKTYNLTDDRKRQYQTMGPKYSKAFLTSSNFVRKGKLGKEKDNSER